MSLDSDLVVIQHVLKAKQFYKESKNNPNHSPLNGEFSSGGGGSIGASSAWKESYALRAGAGLARYAKAHNMSEEAYQKAADAHVAGLLKDAAPWTRMHETSLVAMINDGRFKSQFETKASSGLVSEKRRIIAEENLFNLSAQTPSEKRPIYGYMTEHPDGVIAREGFQKQYGDIAVHMKDDILAHTTVTGGDSMNATFAGTTATLLPTLVKNAGRNIFDVMNDPMRFQKASDVFPYLEAQFHGGVAASQIKEIVFHAPPQEATIKLLQEKNIAYRIALQPKSTARAQRGKKAGTTLDCIAMLQTRPGWFLVRGDAGTVRITDTLEHVLYPPMTIAAVIARDAWEKTSSLYTVDTSFTDLDVKHNPNHDGRTGEFSSTNSSGHAIVAASGVSGVQSGMSVADSPLEKTLEAKHPGVKFDLSGIAPRVAERIGAQVDKLFGEYPDVAKTFTYVGTRQNKEKLPFSLTTYHFP